MKSSFALPKNNDKNSILPEKDHSSLSKSAIIVPRERKRKKFLGFLKWCFGSANTKVKPEITLTQPPIIQKSESIVNSSLSEVKNKASYRRLHSESLGEKNYKIDFMVFGEKMSKADSSNKDQVFETRIDLLGQQIGKNVGK